MKKGSSKPSPIMEITTVMSPRLKRAPTKRSHLLKGEDYLKLSCKRGIGSAFASSVEKNGGHNTCACSCTICYC